MKSLLLIPIVAVALFANSCRTEAPLDPLTMKANTRCLPENYPPGKEIHPTK